MKHIVRVGARVGAAIVLAVGVLTGCTSARTTPRVVVVATDADIATALRLAAGYDYPAATRALQGDTSLAAQRTRRAIAHAAATARPWGNPLDVSHLFYHSLIVDPTRAFAPGQPERTGYAQYMVTISEFRAQLHQMYLHGYVLVHPQRLVATDTSGVMRPATILLPPGRKPLVLSVDDVNYYTYMEGAGFASNLTLTDGQVTSTYVDAQGRTHLGAYDVPTVVDDFVRQHPDFSYRGDKGIIAETGYNGVLGYRSSVSVYGNTPATHAQGQLAKAVATALKSEGWQFASHSWGHISMTTSSLAWIEADARRWDAEVKPLVGATDEFVFPFGADISGIAPYTSLNAKFRFLHDTEGFDYFFPIDATRPAWSQLSGNAWRQARIDVDGISMQRELDGRHTPLENFFDTRSTIDPKRPLPVPGSVAPKARRSSAG